MRKELRTRAVKGVGWAFFSSTVVRGVQIITTLTLARLLMPADFGIFSLSSLIVSALVIFRDVGFAQVIIYRQDDPGKSASTAFMLSMLTSAFLSVLLFVAAPFLGSAFGETAIISPIKAMAPTMLISGAANVPLALLDKELRFRTRAVPELVGALTYAIISIMSATFGLRAWSLVIGWIAMTVATTIATWWVVSWRPALEFDRAEARVIVGYGKHLMVASLVVFAFFQIDKAAIGAWLGVVQLGFYSMAFTVCNLPATNLSHVVNRVMFPTYSILQNDLTEMRQVYLRTIKWISLVAFPAAVGIYVLAGPVVTVFYGDKWLPAIPLFHVLAVYGLIRSIGSTASAVFMSTGNPRYVQRVSTLQLVAAVPFLYTFATRWGPLGVAWLFTGAYAIGTLYALSRVQRILGIYAVQYVKTVTPSLSSAAAAGVVAWTPAGVLGEARVLTVFLTAVLVVAAYFFSISVTDRSAAREFRAMLAASRSGSSVPEAGN